jgi:hypothetical protein
MTDVVTGTCERCGAENFGTRYCETCGTDQQAAIAASPAVPVVSPVTYLRAVTAIGLILVVGVPALVADIVAAAGSYAFYSVGYPVLAALMIAATAVVACVAVNRSPIQGGARLAAILVAAIGGGLDAVIHIFAPATAFGDWLFAICLFVSWALSARFRGFGYFGLGIGIVLSWLLSAVQPALSNTVFSAVGAVGYDILGMVFEVLEIVAAVGSAIAFERLQARRAANPRPSAPPSGLSTQPPIQYSYPVQPAAQSLAPAGVVGMPYQPVASYGPGFGYAQRTNGFAVASLILGLLGISLLAIIFGHVAISQIRRSGERGSGLAVTGLVFGYLWIVGSVIYVIAVSAAASSIGY